MVEKVEKPRRRRGRKKENLSLSSEDAAGRGETQKDTKKEEDTANNISDTPSPSKVSQRKKLSFYPHKSLLLVLSDDAPSWYNIGESNPDRNATIISSSSLNNNNNKKKATPPPADVVQSYRNLADDIYRHELQLFSQNSTSGGDERWVENTMRKGTLKDRVAAMSVVSSTNPMHKMTGGSGGLDQLLHLAKSAKSSSQQQRVNQLVGEALVDLFLETYIPQSRKLYSLNQRPLMDFWNNPEKTLSPRILLLWRFEELVKERYTAFLSLLETWLATDTSTASSSSGGGGGGSGSGGLELQKIQALKTASHLLSTCPEGEDRLLRMIVNKIGDPHKKTASAASHNLRNVLETHPVMSSVVAREVMQLAHRPHLSQKALYNCIIFLNQLKLDSSSENLASKLIQTYFRLFEVAVKQQQKHHQQAQSEEKKTIKARLLSALLTGVNRAHPFLPSSDESLEDKERIDALYRIAHLTSSPGTSTQALMLLYHLAIGVASSSDDDERGESISDEKTCTQIKKKQQSSSSSNEEDSKRQDRFYRTLYSTLNCPTMLCHGGTRHHMTLYFNLLYKSMKYDTSPDRVLAFAKRLIHTAIHALENPSGVLSASLFLLSEVAKFQPVLRSHKDFVRWFHTNSDDVMSEGDWDSSTEFNPTKRDPRGAFGGDKHYNDSSSYQNTTSSNTKGGAGKNVWEASLLLHHYHPSVSKFANDFKDGAIEYGGDPLRDFALIQFLDRFAYRHPKSRKKNKQQEDQDSKNDEAESNKTQRVGERKFNVSSLSSNVPVNDVEFWGKSNNNNSGSSSSAETEFYLKFFKERAKRDALKGFERSEASMKDAVSNANLEDSDEEEEAFANELAEKFMEDNGNGQAHFDEEDPDMEGWDDMYSSDDEGVGEKAGLGESNRSDEDAFMDAAGSDSDSDGDGAEVEVEVEVESSNINMPNNISSVDNDDSEDDEGDAFMDNLIGEDDMEEIKNNNRGGTNKNKKKEYAAFADAEDYEQMIADAWKDRDELMKSKEDKKDKQPTKKKKKKASELEDQEEEEEDNMGNSGDDTTKRSKKKKKRKKN